jgi:hypothetical protein
LFKTSGISVVQKLELNGLKVWLSVSSESELLLTVTWVNFGSSLEDNPVSV